MFVRGIIHCLLVLLLCEQTAAGQSVKDSRLSIRFASSTVEQATQQLKEASPVNIAYDAARLRLKRWRIPARQFDQAPLKQILDYLFQDIPVEWKEVEGSIVLSEKIASPQERKAPPAGSIAGRIIDEENAQPIGSATISIGNKNLLSAMDGSFTISLPPGHYTARISSVGYATKNITGIDVRDNAMFTMELTLKREKNTLNSVMVTASARKETVAALYVRQKNAAGITDGISAEQIGRTPDKNIAEALKRISGVTNLDNKYVVVRGLSERYNQAMMNGQQMPSTELNRKNFSYDLIPSNLVDNVIVIKTLTPDQSAEFGGGLVQVNTKDIPTENSVSITVGTSYNDKTTGKDFRSPEIGRGQYLGVIPRNRKLLGSTGWKSRESIVNGPHFTPVDQGGDYTLKDPSLFANNWGIHHYSPLPSMNGQISLARVISLKQENRKIGIIASASYRNNWQISDMGMSRDGYAPNPAADSASFTGKRYGFVTNLGGLAGISYRTKKHKFSLSSIYLRTLDQQFISGTGHNDVTGPNSAGYNDLFSVTDLWQTQLKTEHLLHSKGMKLNLSLSYTKLDRQKPDNHQANLEYLGAGEDSPHNPNSDFTVLTAVSSGASAGALRWWSRAFEKNLAWNADLSIPFNFSIGKLDAGNLLKAGYAGWEKDRSFWVLITGSKFFTNTAAPLSEVFDPSRGGEIYSPRFGDDFHRKPILHAGYLMMDNKIGKKLRLVWGARGEYYNLNGFNALLEDFVEKQRKNNNDLTDYSELFNREPNWNFFPSANITYSVHPKMNLRLAYSKSIIRPDLREISFFREYDFELGGSYWSQTPIISTKIHHYDLRYEWYPSAGEVFSLTLFYKKMLYPMEIFALPNRLFELRNDKDAINKGIELELRKSLKFIDLPVIRDITLYGNTTRLFSTVRAMELSFNGTNADYPNKLFMVEHVGPEEKRPQSGASNFMYNAGINYDHKAISISGSFNYIANRFYRVGDANTGSLYEQPMKSLDAQIAVKLMKDKGLIRLNASNLLNSSYLIYINVFDNGTYSPADGKQPSAKELKYAKGDVIDYVSAPGRTFSLSFHYNF
jgi:hypothetical protein